MAATTGYMAMRLARIAFAGIDHEGLRPGQWRPLSVDEMKKLKANYGEPKRIRPQRALLVQGKKAATKQQADKRKKQAAKRRTPKSR
jgi:hypothetical protein